MDLMENELYKKYPKVAPSADMYGFRAEDLDILMDKIREDQRVDGYFHSDSSKQVALKSIIMRVNLKRDDFFRYVEGVKSRNIPDNILEKYSGKYNLLVYKAILK